MHCIHKNLRNIFKKRSATASWISLMQSTISFLSLKKNFLYYYIIKRPLRQHQPWCLDERTYIKRFWNVMILNTTQKCLFFSSWNLCVIFLGGYNKCATRSRVQLHDIIIIRNTKNLISMQHFYLFSSLS